MILGFLPNREESLFQSSRRHKVLKKDHIERYSENQVSVLYAVFGVVFSTCLFWLNYEYQFMSKQSIIWIVFVSFPILVHSFEYFKNSNLRKSV